MSGDFTLTMELKAEAKQFRQEVKSAKDELAGVGKAVGEAGKAAEAAGNPLKTFVPVDGLRDGARSIKDLGAAIANTGAGASTAGKQAAGMLDALSGAGKGAANASAAIAGMEKAAGGATAAVKLQAHQVTNLGYQLQDIAVQLAGGQNPFLVMMQQVPQAAGAVGGFSNLLGLALRPAVVGVALPLAAVAGGAVLVASHMAQTQSRTRELTVSLKAMGDVAGVTGEQLKRMSETAASRGPFSRAETFDAAKGLAGHRQLSGQTMSDILGIGVDLAVATGQDLAAVTDSLAKAFEGGYQGVRQLDDALGFLTRSELDQIRTMTEQGRQAEAMQLAMDRLKGRMKGLADEGMGSAAKATRDLANAWSDFLDRVANSDTAQSVIKGLTGALQGLANIAGKSLAAPAPTVGWQLDNTKLLLAHEEANLADLREKMQASGEAWNFELQATEERIARLRKELAALQGQATSTVSTAAQGANEASGKALSDILDGIAERRRVLAAPVPARPAVQAVIQAENVARDRKLTEGDAAEAKRGLVGLAGAEQADAVNQAVQALAREEAAQRRLIGSLQGSTEARLAAQRATFEEAQAAQVGADAARRLGEAYARVEQVKRDLAAGETLKGLNEEALAARDLADATAQGTGAMREATIQVRLRALEAKNLTAAEKDVAAALIRSADADRYRQSITQRAVAASPSLTYDREAEGLREVMEEMRRLGATTEEITRIWEDAERRKLAASTEWRDGLNLAYLDIQAEGRNAARQIYDDTMAVRRSFRETSVDVIMQTRTMADGVLAILNEFSRRLVGRMVDKFAMPIFDGAIDWLLGGFGGGGGSGYASSPGVSTGFSDQLGAIWGVQNHKGGLGRDGAPRLVDPAWYDDAPRFHSGYTPPPKLRSDEMAAVILKNEEVLTEADPRHINNVRRAGASSAAWGSAGGGPLIVNLTLVNEGGQPLSASVEERDGDGGPSERDLVVTLAPLMNQAIRSGRVDGGLRSRGVGTRMIVKG
ncbi:MAG: phage tail length tape measure family protein [Magnetospirillum sp. WYHS-4]